MAEVQFFLPELTVDKKITPPSKAGLWKHDAKTVIKGISDAIITGENAQGVSSIPDIWARPLMFQNFLFSVFKKLDPKIEKKEALTPLEKRAFQEWKGLLSILALSNTKLSFDKIEITSFSPNKEDRFCRALKMLSPRPVYIEKNKAYQWTDILLIKYNDVAVGAFSPSTLVYTAVDYSNNFKKRFDSGAGKSSIVLDANGYLCPPSKEKDLLAVGEWITNIKSKLDTLLNTRDESREADKRLATMNSVLLDIWLDEIKTQLNIFEGRIESKEVKVSETVPYFSENNTPAFLNNYAVYEALLHPLETDTSFGELSKSDIELKSERNFLNYNGKEIKHVLLISDKLYSEDYRIWNQLRFTALGNNITDILSTYFSKSAGQEVRGKEVAFASEGILWIRPELFFVTNTLLTNKTEGYFLNINEKETNVNTKYVLPFTRHILNFFSPEEIIETLRPAYDDKGDRVIFSFTLPVINNDQGLLIKKTFRKRHPEKSEGSILEAEVPVIEIFPDYLGENWRRYFLLQSHADTFTAVPVGNNITDKNSQRKPTIQAGGERIKIKIDELKGNNVFPDGIEINSSKNEPLGLILLDKYLKREKEDALKTKLEIGIDFGTSNTNVYFKEENAEGKRWCYNFPEYTRQLTTSNTEFRNEVLNNSFIPTIEHPLPIPTALLNRYNSQEKPALVLDYFIFFKKKESDYTIPQNVYTDLKWDQDNKDAPGQQKDDIDNTDWFIESLLFLVFLEVFRKNCKQVIINCTFPKAFSQDDLKRFGRHWEQALERLLHKEDRILNAMDDNQPYEYNKNKPEIIGPYLMTEGIAAGYFFANPSKFTTTRNIEKAKLADGAICLDVGGGTTDISIWFDSGTKAFYDTSVLLAGRQISEFIRINSDIYNNLFTPGGADALKAKKESDTAFAAVLNMVLKAEEKEVYNNLAKYAANTSFQSLKRIILLEFGAIAYYTALLCKSAIEKQGGEGLLEKIKNTGINLYWGGNGAKFISWLDYGLFNANSNCVKFLNTIFYYALKLHGIQPHSNILQFASPEPKSEACGGIIVSEFSERETSSVSGKSNKAHQQTESIVELDINILEDNNTDNGGSSLLSTTQEFIGGEKIELNDNAVIESYQPVSNKSLFKDNRTIVKDTTLYELELFVKIVNQAGLALGLLKEGNQLILTQNNKAKLKSSISDIFKNMQQKPPDKRRLEPIFILEIKELMNLILMGII